MWRDFFETEYCIFNDTLICKVKHIDGLTAFSHPLGPDTKGGIKELESYCRNISIPLVFCSATEAEIAVYRELYPMLQITANEDWDDYLYKADDLIYLEGRKYSGQRNHINFFVRNYSNFAAEEITQNNLCEVSDFYKNAISDVAKDTRIFREGREKTFELLNNFRQYNMLGCLLRVDGAVIGFAVGEILKDTLFVHVERVDTGYRGAYQMMAKLFPSIFADRGFLFVNREEDDGDAGLRTAKKAYHPIEMIRKHLVVVPSH